MPDISSTATLVLGFSALNFVLGYILGHYGLATIKSDITSIKDLLSGQAKVAVVTTPVAAVETTVVPASAQTAQAGMV